MRDIKRNFPHYFRIKKYPEKMFSCSFHFGYDFPYEKFFYYNGKVFRSLLFKDFMAGHRVREYVRTKITGSSIHKRGKKKSKKSKKLGKF